MSSFTKKGSTQDSETGKKTAVLKSKRTIVLLKPAFGEEISLFKAFQKRKTIREISDKKLPLQTLSDLLWAACGVNRKKGPFGIAGRTAATASNSQEIDVYVALPEGTYLYDAVHHKLILISPGDLRSLAIGPGQTGFGEKAPVRLIYVADINKLANTKGYQEPGLQNPEIQKSYYFVDTGIIAGNVYLFAASRGLGAWFHNCNKQVLAKKLNLHDDQRVLFGQTIGFRSSKKILQ
jgi:SagB-type dehydrogenase family enzyme